MSGRKHRSGHHWLVRLYPRAWRDRYGDEFSALLDAGCGPRATFDVLRGAAIEHIFNPSGLGGRIMQTYRGSVIAMAKHPSAFVPLILSGCALALLAVYVALYGVGGERPPHDEGPAASIYHLLIGAQVLIIPWFLLRWGRTDAKAALGVLALQVLAIAASLVPLFMVEH